MDGLKPITQTDNVTARNARLVYVCYAKLSFADF